jgi:hypothetical protein
MASAKGWATIVWISKNTHWVVVQLDNDEGSVFRNEESDLEGGEQLFADWTAYGGSEQVRCKSTSHPFDVYIEGRFFSLQGALEAGKKWANEV